MWGFVDYKALLKGFLSTDVLDNEVCRAEHPGVQKDGVYNPQYFGVGGIRCADSFLRDTQCGNTRYTQTVGTTYTHHKGVLFQKSANLSQLLLKGCVVLEVLFNLFT